MKVAYEVIKNYSPQKIQEIRNVEDEISVIRTLNDSLHLVENNELTQKGTDLIEFANKNHNPSKEGYNRYENFEKLKGGDWVCSECELSGSQTAACIRHYRNLGFVFDSKSGRGNTSYQRCDECDDKTTHRRMKYPFPVEEKILREDMTKDFRERVKELYDCREAFDNEKKDKSKLEVDHRRPRIRWEDSETINFNNITDKEIRERFQMLSSKNNQRKSRACERCKSTGKRQCPVGTNYFYEGGENYNEELGCEGCFYYNPDKWRENLEQELQDEVDEFGRMVRGIRKVISLLNSVLT